MAQRSNLQIKKFGYSTQITKLIISYSEGRKFKIKLNATTSSWQTSSAGVPQGSLLSPLLFNIYVADLPTTEGIATALYAGDLLITATDKNLNFAKNLTQDAVNTISSYYSRWKIKVNAQKTEAVVFKKEEQTPKAESK